MDKEAKMELTRQNYHSREMSQKYMSVSQFKEFRDCEARALAEIKGKWVRPQTDSLLVGSYVDEYFNGDLETFKVQHPEMFTRTGELKAPFKKAEQIIERIEKDPYMRKQLGGKRQVIMTGFIGGVEWKIMIDSLHPSKTVDGKVMKDCGDVRTKDGYEPFWRAYGYDIQGAVFRQVRAQNEKGKLKPFELAVATKEDEPDLRIFRFTEGTLGNAMHEVVENVGRYDLIKQGKIKPVGCGECAYCKSIRKMSKSLVEEI
jgi:hypothetical protein